MLSDLVREVDALIAHIFKQNFGNILAFARKAELFAKGGRVVSRDCVTRSTKNHVEVVVRLVVQEDKSRK